MSFIVKPVSVVNPFRERERTREVLASTALRSTQQCEPKPTVVGDAAMRSNTDETLVNKGQFSIRGYSRCGDRGGDTLIKGVFIEISPDFVQ